MSIRSIRLFAVILAALAATPAAAQRRPRVAILEVRALGIAPEKAQALSEVALTEASNIAGLDVIGRSDIQSMIGFEKEKQMLGCSDDSKCMTEIAGAMGVDWILVGSLGQFDALYRLDLKLIDAKRSKIGGRIGESIEGSQARLVSAVQAGIHKLLDPIAAAAGAPVSRSSAPVERPAAAPATPTAAGAAASPAPDEPPGRRWALELRAGYARVSGGHTEPAALDPAKTNEFALGGAYRQSRRWSFLARFDLYPWTTRSVSSPYGTSSIGLWGIRLAAGAAWSPLGNPWFSVAADVGVASMVATAEVPYTETVRQSRKGASAGLELRVDYPLGERWFVGARAGSRIALVGFKLEASNPYERIRMENDVAHLAIDAAVGCRF